MSEKNLPVPPTEPTTEPPSHPHAATWILVVCVTLLGLLIAFNVSC